MTRDDTALIEEIARNQYEIESKDERVVRKVAVRDLTMGMSVGSVKTILFVVVGDVTTTAMGSVKVPLARVLPDESVEFEVREYMHADCHVAVRFRA